MLQKVPGHQLQTWSDGLQLRSFVCSSSRNREQVREITAIHPTQNSRKEAGGFRRREDVEGIVGVCIGSKGVFGTVGKGDGWISRSSDSPFTGECLNKPCVYRAPDLVCRDQSGEARMW
jgi:hypothetical protein